MARAKQVISILVGLLFGVLGGIALARTGVGDLRNHATALGLDHTTLLAYIEIGYGVLMLLVGGLYPTERTGVILLGTLALGFGIVVVAAHQQLHDFLGVHQANGVLYIVAGAVALLAALIPTGEPTASPAGTEPPGL
ncbi:MAG: hypothetical protein ACRDI0_13605 [Actinomycetota bacterium]